MANSLILYGGFRNRPGAQPICVETNQGQKLYYIRAYFRAGEDIWHAMDKASPDKDEVVLNTVSADE